MEEKTTGDIIRWLRQNQGWTQDELAEKMGLQKSAIQKYENNTIRNPKMDSIRCLCELFGVPPWVFVYPEHIQPETWENPDALRETAYEMAKNTNIMLKLTFINESGRERISHYISDLLLIDKYKR